MASPENQMTLEDAFDQAVEQAQKRVTSCPTCQPYDEGEVVWIFGSLDSWVRELILEELESTGFEEAYSGLESPHRWCRREHLRGGFCSPRVQGRVRV